MFLWEKHNWTLPIINQAWNNRTQPAAFIVCTPLQHSAANKVLVMNSYDTSPGTISNVYAIWWRGEQLIYFLLGVGLHPDIHHSQGCCLCACSYLITLQHHNMGQSTTASVIVLSSNSLLLCSLLTRALAWRLACTVKWVWVKKENESWQLLFMMISPLCLTSV